MLYLKVDCSRCNSQAELCVNVCEKLITLSKVICSEIGNHDFDMSHEKTLDNIDDIITCYDFTDCSCKLVIYNFAQARTFLGDLTDNFISIFERMHNEYPRNFLYEIYEDDNFKAHKTVTFEFIDLENKD